MKASLSTILFNLPADLACPCRHCFPSRQRHTLPKQKIVCSPTHSFGEKKLHFPIVCGNMMEVHWGQRMRRETQSAQSAQTYHESEFHRNIVFKAQSKTSDPCALFSVVQTLFTEELYPGCSFVTCVKFHIFLEAQHCCINYGFNWAIYKYTKLKIS